MKSDQIPLPLPLPLPTAFSSSSMHTQTLMHTPMLNLRETCSSSFGHFLIIVQYNHVRIQELPLHTRTLILREIGTLSTKARFYAVFDNSSFLPLRLLLECIKIILTLSEIENLLCRFRRECIAEHWVATR